MDLFPVIEPYSSGNLDVGDGHTLYWERVGTPGARPAVALHGGPGSGASLEMRRLFDPDRFDVLLFDQRGCGRSAPTAGLHANTTQHLIRDIEMLRKQVVGVDKWLVFGGSWGSLLGLAYAQAHPQQVDALVLRGIFTCTEEELDWFYRTGTQNVFPDKWERFVAPVAPADRADVLGAFARLLNDPDPRVHETAAVAWCTYEDEISVMDSAAPRKGHLEDIRRQLAVARLENHYFLNRCFLASGQILEDVAKISHIPAVLIHGRYDMVCPLRFAWDLKRRWPAARFELVEMTGHSLNSPPMASAVVAAIASFVSV